MKILALLLPMVPMVWASLSPSSFEARIPLFTARNGQLGNKLQLSRITESRINNLVGIQGGHQAGNEVLSSSSLIGLKFALQVALLTDKRK